MEHHGSGEPVLADAGDENLVRRRPVTAIEACGGRSPPGNSPSSTPTELIGSGSSHVRPIFAAIAAGDRGRRPGQGRRRAEIPDWPGP